MPTPHTTDGAAQAPASKAGVGRAHELFKYAVAHHRAGRLDAARALYLDFFARSPDYAPAWTNYGALLEDKGQYETAIAAHRRALTLDPTLSSAKHNLAKTLGTRGDFAEAAAIRKALLDETPTSVERERDLCIVLRGAGEHQAVIERITRAEREGRVDAGGLMQRALSRLMLADYKGGFADYECRHDSGEIGLPKNVCWPRWQGEPVAGKKVLVLPEQGFGDAILSSRFLPGLKALGAEVHMQVKKPLERLLSRVEGVDHLLDKVFVKDHYDYFTPNMSLPHLVGVPDPLNPPPAPRLHIPDDSRERARRIVAPFAGRFRIGVVWTGSLSYKSNNRRSTSADRFASLALVPGVQLFSLYKGKAHADFIDSGFAGLIVDACSNDRDFADSAALIDEMDLMITTDTAVVHVAASLGKPVWNLLSHEGFWLYGQQDTTPWYPSMRLFRQERPGDWDTVFQRAEQSLVELLEHRTNSRSAA